MATLTIRNLDIEVKNLLAAQAKRNNRSMEAQAREALTRATLADSNRVDRDDREEGFEKWDPQSGEGFGTYLARRLSGLGEDLIIPPRTSSHRPDPFSEEESS